MTISEQFTMALRVFRELESELGRPRRDLPPPPAPALSRTAQEVGPLPAGSLLLGVACDGAPLLLDLYDPTPGSILVTGDRRAGKTALLQALARASDLTSDPGEVQFAVLTHAPGEWTEIEALPGSMGVWPAAHPSAARLLSRLAAWGGHPHNDGRAVVLLLVDGLDALVLSDHLVRRELRWLLTEGPQRRIWPVATVNAGRAPRFSSWLERFGLCIFGHVRRPDLAEALAGDPAADLAGLFPGVQFALRRPEGWLEFWIPSPDEERRLA